LEHREYFELCTSDASRLSYSQSKKLRVCIRAFIDNERLGAVSLFGNLALVLSIEVVEIVERVQWLIQEQSQNLPLGGMAEVRAKIGDAMIYLTELSEKLESNPIETAEGKLEIKYPAALVKGRASKYTER
jgi:hypothetical protein